MIIPNKFEMEDLTMRFYKNRGKKVEVLQLLARNSYLNLIELTWSLVKSNVARKNATFKIIVVKTFTAESVANGTRENWRKAVVHTWKILSKIFCEVDFSDLRSATNYQCHYFVKFRLSDAAVFPAHQVMTIYDT